MTEISVLYMTRQLGSAWTTETQASASQQRPSAKSDYGVVWYGPCAVFWEIQSASRLSGNSTYTAPMSPGTARDDNGRSFVNLRFDGERGEEKAGDHKDNKPDIDSLATSHQTAASTHYPDHKHATAPIVGVSLVLKHRSALRCTTCTSPRSPLSCSRTQS